MQYFSKLIYKEGRQERIKKRMEDEKQDNKNGQ